MRILIKKNACAIHSRSIPAHMGYTTSQFEFREMLSKVQGTWVEVDVEYLFDNQYNTVPIEGVTDRGLRIMEDWVEEIEGDARIDKVKCNWCGTVNHRTRFIYTQEDGTFIFKCPYCDRTGYVKELVRPPKPLLDKG